MNFWSSALHNDFHHLAYTAVAFTECISPLNKSNAVNSPYVNLGWK